MNGFLEIGFKFDFNQNLSLVKGLAHATGFKYSDKKGLFQVQKKNLCKF